MTQEEKDLLLKDLCARLPYGIRLKIGEHSDYTLCGYMPHDEHPIKVKLIENEKEYIIEVYIEHIKPYLRPMSSMTEEEQDEFLDLIIPVDGGKAVVEEDKIEKYNEFIYSRHLDNRGLIEKGLALEAPEDMYKID